MEPQEKTLAYVEFETKYRVEGSLVYEFKKLVQALPGLQNFSYVESDDIYYVKGTDEFLRHRFDAKNLNSRQEITFKRKSKTQNNINRVENNIRVDGNTVQAVAELCTNLGYRYNFKISKFVHIYRFEDATLPFYTVIDEDGEMSHFMEIEVDEEKLHGMTEDQAWEVIVKYEKLLAPLGITPQKRLRKSLFEMYRKESKVEEVKAV